MPTQTCLEYGIHCITQRSFIADRDVREMRTKHINKLAELVSPGQEPWRASELWEMLHYSRSVMLVAQHNERYIGSATLTRPARLARGFGELVDLAVMPAYRSQGIGRNLVIACIIAANRQRIRTLKAVSTHEPKTGKNVFLKTGFRPVDKSPGVLVLDPSHYTQSQYVTVRHALERIDLTDIP